MPQADDEGCRRDRDQARRFAWRVTGISLMVALVAIGILVVTFFVVLIVTVDQWTN